MKFNVGDRVYWPNAPKEEEAISECVLGVVGIVTRAENHKYAVTFRKRDNRAPFTDDELILEAVYNSPLSQALR